MAETTGLLEQRMMVNPFDTGKTDEWKEISQRTQAVQAEIDELVERSIKALDKIGYYTIIYEKVDPGIEVLTPEQINLVLHEIVRRENPAGHFENYQVSALLSQLIMNSYCSTPEGSPPPKFYLDAKDHVIHNLACLRGTNQKRRLSMEVYGDVRSAGYQCRDADITIHGNLGEIGFYPENCNITVYGRIDHIDLLMETLRTYGLRKVVDEPQIECNVYTTDEDSYNKMVRTKIPHRRFQIHLMDMNGMKLKEDRS